MKVREIFCCWQEILWNMSRIHFKWFFLRKSLENCSLWIVLSREKNLSLSSLKTAQCEWAWSETISDRQSSTIPWASNTLVSTILWLFNNEWVPKRGTKENTPVAQSLCSVCIPMYLVGCSGRMVIVPSFYAGGRGSIPKRVETLGSVSVKQML